MTAQSIEKIIPVKEQRFVLPGRQSWQQFKAIQALMAEVSGVRVSYLDGCVEKTFAKCDRFLLSGKMKVTVRGNAIALSYQNDICKSHARVIPIGYKNDTIL